MNNILNLAEEFAKKEYKKNDTFHQYEHIEAVMKRAMELANNFNNVDYESLQLAIIFHDIEYTSYKSHPDASVVVAERFLRKYKYPEDKIVKIKEIMLNHSTPHRSIVGEAKLIEGKIIYDADKSIFITNKETYNKYFPLLYLSETKKIIQITF